MAASARVEIDVVAKTKQAEQALRDTGKGAEGTQSKLAAVAKGVATGFAVKKILDFTGAAIKAGSALQDNLGASSVIFGRAAGAVDDFSKKAATAYGISRNASLEAANTFAAFGKQAGLTGVPLAKFSTKLTGLAGDLASFRGTSTEQAITAVGAALRGESEPMRAYGVMLDAATLKARGLAMGLVKAKGNQAGIASANLQSAAAMRKYADETKKHGKNSQEARTALERLKLSQMNLTKATAGSVPELTNQQKVLAAQAEIYAQTKDAQGDFVRTSSSAANQQKALKAEMENVSTSIGTALLPVLQKLLPYLSQLATFVEQNISWLLPLAAVVGVLAIAWNIASIAATLFGVSMAAALLPVLLVIAGIAALIAIAILLVKNWDKVKAAAAAVWAFMVAAWAAIRGAVQTAFDWIKTNWPMLLAILTGPIGLAVLAIVRNWGTIKAAAAGVLSWLRSAWSTVYETLTAPFRAAWQWISHTFDQIRGAVQSALDFVSRTASSIGNALKGPVNAILRAWNAIEFQVPKVDIGPVHFGGQTIGLPDIPLLANGGAVLRTGLAIVHAGETYSGVGRSLPGSGTTVVNINVTTTGLGADSPQIQRAVVRALRGYTTRNGPLDVPVRTAS